MQLNECPSPSSEVRFRRNLRQTWFWQGPSFRISALMALRFSIALRSALSIYHNIHYAIVTQAGNTANWRIMTFSTSRQPRRRFPRRIGIAHG
jgi:hypothetical protein